MVETKEERKNKPLKISLVVDRSNEQSNDVTEIDIFLHVVVDIENNKRLCILSNGIEQNSLHSFIQMIIVENVLLSSMTKFIK